MRRLLWIGVLGVLVVGGLEVQAVPTITVVPASAPNAFGSPSYAGWQANAIAALGNGWSSAGVAGTPSFYSVSPSVIPVSDNVVTGFASWKGQADPGAVFGPGFASELGNRLAFGLVVNGNGEKVSISDLAFSAVSTDPTNSLGFNFGVGSYNYSDGYVGVVFGGGGPTFITSGPNTQLVDMIIGRGSGNAWPIYNTDPGPTEQAQIDGVGLKFTLSSTPFQFTGTYTMDADGGPVTGSASVTFGQPGGAVPEPITAGLSLLSLASLGIALTARRR